MRALSLGEAGASLGKSSGFSTPGEQLGDSGLNRTTTLLLYLYTTTAIIKGKPETSVSDPGDPQQRQYRYDKIDLVHLFNTKKPY
jgi:hypothetical protein